METILKIIFLIFLIILVVSLLAFMVSMMLSEKTEAKKCLNIVFISAMVLFIIGSMLLFI